MTTPEAAAGSDPRARVLVACDAYLPGYKGGSLRSVAHMIERLGGEFDFHVLTADRDYGEREPYAGVERDRWVRAHGATVFYASPPSRRLSALPARVHEAAPQALYLNSVFSPLAVRLLALRRAGRLPRPLPVLLAPTGELHPAALAQKRWKKAPYLALARRIGLYSGLTWRANDEDEACDVRRIVPDADVRIAAEMPAAALPGWTSRPARPKAAGRARLVYFSRVTPKKNLLFLLEALRQVQATVELTVFGPVDDEAYWKRCRGAAARLPAHVHFEAPGPLPHDRAAGTLALFDALVLPTLGENYGYAVLEALAAGCPVLVSGHTPWRDLEALGAGRVLPLEAARWAEAVDALAALDGDAHQAWRRAARRHAEARAAAPHAVAELRALLQESVGPP